MDIVDTLTGAIFGAFITLAILHLYYNKLFTLNGWVDKNTNIKRYRITVTIYFIGSILSLLYMIYS